MTGGKYFRCDLIISLFLFLERKRKGSLDFLKVDTTGVPLILIDNEVSIQFE